jgi:hypothetical protein
MVYLGGLVADLMISLWFLGVKLRRLLRRRLRWLCVRPRPVMSLGMVLGSTRSSTDTDPSKPYIH